MHLFFMRRLLSTGCLFSQFHFISCDNHWLFGILASYIYSSRIIKLQFLRELI